MVQETSADHEFDQRTGRLFERLWGPYDSRLFSDSVTLFEQRLEAIGFDLEFFRGKICLDAGCGGGRNSIAMARLGASEVHGIDIGAAGIIDARQRAEDLPNVLFQEASVESLPFPDQKFDLIWCAGVLMHVGDEERAMDELTRVLKPGGVLYMLVYATGGMRWPLMQLLRPIASELGQESVEMAVELSGLPANKRRTFLDDLFCPKFDFFHWERLRLMLEKRGFSKIERWGPEARFDHEHSLSSYREDLESLERLLAAGRNAFSDRRSVLFELAGTLTKTSIETIQWFEAEVTANRISTAAAMDRVIGQGHHRLFATRGR